MRFVVGPDFFHGLGKFLFQGIEGDAHILLGLRSREEEAQAGFAFLYGREGDGHDVDAAHEQLGGKEARDHGVTRDDRHYGIALGFAGVEAFLLGILEEILGNVLQLVNTLGFTLENLQGCVACNGKDRRQAHAM